jgi:hypothetical protein
MVAEPVVRETLGLADDVLIGTTLCVGYPDRPFGPVRANRSATSSTGTDGETLYGFQSR